MLGWSAQSWIVVAIVIGAAAYLSRSAWQSWRRRGVGTCCEKGCGHAADTSNSAASPATSTRTTFIPLDNIVDLARRRREERDQRAGDSAP